MSLIHVPKPPLSAMNKDRPVSSLLKTQIRHLQEAEFRLPVRQQTNIYINRIKTEGEAAEYIRQVTAMLHPEGAAKRPRQKGKSAKSGTFDLAAVGESKSAKKSKPKSKKNKR